jgi:integrase
MSVRKRAWTTKSGERKEVWIVDYVDAQRDRHIATFARQREAKEYHDTVHVEVRRGVHTPPSKSATVMEAAEAWIKRVEANGMRGQRAAERTTVRQYRQHVNLHIVPRLGRHKVAKLAKPHIENFRNGLLADLSRPLARKVLTSLKSILRTANHAHVADDVSIGAEGRGSKLEADRDFPTPAEIRRLLAHATDIRRRTLLLTAVFTGLRASELRGLRWKDVDLKAGQLEVRQRADRFGKIGAPKSASSFRAVPLPPELANALKQWKLACPNGDAGLVFPSATGAVEHHKNMLRNLGPIMVAAGVVDKQSKPKYGLHALRHFFASWCINPKSRGGRELPPKVVQELLGHHSATLTMDIYGHLFPRGDDRAEIAMAEKALLG